VGNFVVRFSTLGSYFSVSSEIFCVAPLLVVRKEKKYFIFEEKEEKGQIL
jgi:hypothetical protein